MGPEKALVRLGGHWNGLVGGRCRRGTPPDVAGDRLLGDRAAVASSLDRRMSSFFAAKLDILT